MSIDILICSINKDGILERCLDSLSKLTNISYKIFLCVPSIVISQLGTRYDVTYVDRVDDESYKYSKFANRLARYSSGDLICLMNDDVEVITPTSLYNMATVATQPEVGVVGAKLLFPDGTIQHVGVDLLDEKYICHHPFQLKEDNPKAPWNLLPVAPRTAVTGAVSVVRRELFNLVNGYDEQLVAYNDIDFCLKISVLGYKNMFVSDAVFMHHQSFTRGSENNTLERDYEIMRTKWRHLL